MSIVKSSGRRANPVLGAAILLSAGLSAMLAARPAAAQPKAETRIAAIEIQKAISETNEGARATYTLKQLFDKRQIELNAKQDDLLKEKTALEKKCKSMPQAQCQGGMEELQRKLLELQNLMMQYQQEIQKKQGEATQPILVKMLAIVRRIAQRDGYDIVVDRGATHFLRSDLDITDVAIKMYNAESNVPPLPAASTQPAAPKEAKPSKKPGKK
jgi:outer membrane protein